MTLHALACFEQQPRSSPLLQELATGSHPQLSCSPAPAHVQKTVCRAFVIDTNKEPQSSNGGLVLRGCLAHELD